MYLDDCYQDGRNRQKLEALDEREIRSAEVAKRVRGEERQMLCCNGSMAHNN